jgi:hypothetical protein
VSEGTSALSTLVPLATLVVSPVLLVLATPAASAVVALVAPSMAAFASAVLDLSVAVQIESLDMA